MKIKHLCPHCSQVLESECPDIGEGARSAQFAPVGKAIIEDTLVHVLLHCEGILDD